MKGNIILESKVDDVEKTSFTDEKGNAVTFYRVYTTFNKRPVIGICQEKVAIGQKVHIQLPVDKATILPAE